MKSKSKKGFKKLIIWLVVIVLLFGSCAAYFGIYYHGDEEANKALESSLVVEIKENNDYYSFKPLVNLSSSAIIIYPGAKVEAKAYAPICKDLASIGYYVALVKMPLNFAMFGLNKANKVIEDTDYTNYYLAGHSLGGAMGASYISKNASKYKGLILFAAYSTADLTDKNLSVLSIYGSEDKVLNLDNYAKYKSNLPESTVELVIDGGCHSQFASYGAQKGDGEPTISASSFRAQCVSAIAAFTIIA